MLQGMGFMRQQVKNQLVFSPYVHQWSFSAFDTYHYLNIGADQVHTFMETVLHNGSGLFQQDDAPCHTAKMFRTGLRNTKKVMTWLQYNIKTTCVVPNSFTKTGCPFVTPCITLHQLVVDTSQHGHSLTGLHLYGPINSKLQCSVYTDIFLSWPAWTFSAICDAIALLWDQSRLASLLYPSASLSLVCPFFWY